MPRGRALPHCPRGEGSGPRGASGSLSAGTAPGTRRILSAVEGGLKLKLKPQRLLFEARGEQSQLCGPEPAEGLASPETLTPG